MCVVFDCFVVRVCVGVFVSVRGVLSVVLRMIVGVRCVCWVFGWLCVALFGLVRFALCVVRSCLAVRVSLCVCLVGVFLGWFLVCLWCWLHVCVLVGVRVRAHACLIVCVCVRVCV